MKLSPNTLNILKNFAAIQPELVINPGSVIKTISAAKNIMAEASVTETFDKQLGIRDLNEFLNVYTLLEDPADIEFGDNDIEAKSGNTKVSLRLYAIEMLTTPPAKNIEIDKDVIVNLTEAQIGAIRAASSALGNDIEYTSFVGDGKKISLVVNDCSGKNANKLEIDLEQPTNLTFNLCVKTAEIKVLSGDYEVILSKKFISKWVNKSDAVTYYIALDANHSSFNE
jgi:hypothetical protein